MTDEAKAVEIAGYIIERNRHDAPIYILAKAFLALSEKCEKLERVAEAARIFLYHKTSLSIPPMGLEESLRHALSELEPGDSDV